ncbi:hypothetical protein BCR32DRAFT_44118 [Anaeromyces robustus]|uniref:Uncharacterized protein n=1 Tax=Anaeromyces robustus TaxID=1754192 RepID=A0A1Y1XMC1_9FUNG|nr:hypothetical protein BCR32DRAFT_44118 [Anaeromyces robustus]|eukprot:ORX86494.1 hypothetical protein BCR32DRAFT_44118 [Anaeromyces robustus]
MMNQGIKSLSSPLSAKANSAGSNINKRFSVQMVDRGHPNLTNSNGQSNSKHYSIQQTSSMSLKQFQATQSPPIEEENINNIEAFPQQNNVQLYINKSPINQNYR